MANAILSLKNVSVTFNHDSYNERQVLNDLSLDINEGDFISVIGHNGSGKSTLLNVISGLIEVSSGQLVLDGKDITNLSATSRAQFIRRVFQDPKSGTAPRMTVLENLMLAEEKNKFSLKLSSVKSKISEYTELLSKTHNGLETHLKTYTENLSGGQRQALSFTMATMANPRILLLDEHTAALDPTTSVNMMGLTNKVIGEKKLTCLMVTHNLQDAITYGNRLLVIMNGKIIKDIDKTKEEPNIEELYEFF